jgi:hypothetical protein
MPDTARTRAAPASAYRLQLTADFGFADAGELADYLAALGVTQGLPVAYPAGRPRVQARIRRRRSLPCLDGPRR